MSPRVILPFADPATREANAPRVAERLAVGGLIAYPTETVYGFGCALRPPALAALRVLKVREAGKPFLLLVRRRDEIQGVRWTPAAVHLADAFWPGPLTLVLPAEPGALPDEVTGPDGAVALRASPHPAVRAVLEALGEPITSTSANIPGAPPATSAEEVGRVLDALGAPDVWLLDGGRLPPSPPSTIVDCSGRSPHVLRAGAILESRLHRILGETDERS